MSDTFSAEVAVIGGGPAGLVAAIALATAGIDTLLIAPPAEPDHRTTALLAGSVTALETLGVWPAWTALSAASRICMALSKNRLTKGLSRQAGGV